MGNPDWGHIVRVLLFDYHGVLDILLSLVHDYTVNTEDSDWYTAGAPQIFLMN